MLFWRNAVEPVFLLLPLVLKDVPQTPILAVGAKRVDQAFLDHHTHVVIWVLQRTAEFADRRVNLGDVPYIALADARIKIFVDVHFHPTCALRRRH